MTAFGIALVVAVFVAAMAMVAGLDSAFKDTSSPSTMIVLRKGVDSESTSRIALDQLDALRFLPGIKRDDLGNPMVSPELAEQVYLIGPDNTLDSLPVRGLLTESLKVHDKVRIVAGRMFQPGLDEVVIGKLILNRYPGCSLGSDLHVAHKTWKVVGVFEAGGGSFESEVWTDLHSLQGDSKRGSSFNSIRLKLAPGADISSLVRRIADDPRINLEARTEADYYEEQSAYAAKVHVVGISVAAVMAFAAMFAAMNSMYAAVAARTTEIGTLRALGFGPWAIMTSFLLESSILALIAGVAGIILALPVDGLSTTFNGVVTGPTLAFRFHVTYGIVIQAVAFAIVIGLAGGWLPAQQAMRVRVVNALRRQ